LLAVALGACSGNDGPEASETTPTSTTSTDLDRGGPGCGSAALAAAYEHANGVAPTSVAVETCTSGWVLAVVTRPDTGDTDGLNLFRVTADGVELVGDVVPDCAEELTLLGVPEPDLAALGLPVCDGVASD